MSKVFEIKPGYAVRLADGHVMFAVVVSDNNSIKHIGPDLMDVKVDLDAKPELALFGWDKDNDTGYWTMDCYNDNLEFVDGFLGMTEPDYDIVTVYGYATPMTAFDYSDKAMNIRPVLWQRDAKPESKDESKECHATYEDAKKAIDEWKAEIDASDKSEDEKRAQRAYVGFLEMLTDIVHLCEEN